MNPEQLQTLTTELDDAAYTDLLTQRQYSVVAGLLNARATVPNPEAQEETPVTFTWGMFMSLLVPSDILVMYAYAHLADDLREALESDDRPIMFAIWAGLRTVLEPGSVSDVVAAFGDTEPDPNWPPTIFEPSRAQVLGLSPVSAQDAETAHQRMAGF